MLDNFAEPLGRYLMSGIFLKSAYDQITNFTGTVSQMELYGMPFTKPLLLGAIACEVLGSASLIFNRYPKMGAAMLIAVLATATLVYHNPLHDPMEAKPLT